MSEALTHSPRRVLVDHAGNKGIGDIVCELNYYRALRRLYPEAELVSRGSRRLAWGHPLVDRFDETSPDTAFDRIIRQESLARVTADLGEALRREESIFNLFLRHQGFEALPGPPELFVLPQELDEWRSLVASAEDRLLVVYSADSKEPDRRWGQERFQAVARHLEALHGAVLVEIGSGLTEGHLGVGLDLVGQTDLRQAMALLASSDLFMGNNGGLTHLAGGVGTPVLVPWGANSPYEAYAYDDLSVALATDPPCRNCGWTGVFLPECLEVDPQLGRTPCTQDIAVADLIEAADELVPLLWDQRATLRRQKHDRIRRGRDPFTLSGFERESGLVPYARQHLSLGGEAGWFEEHRPDHFRRLQQIVAFPDWSGSDWKRLMAAYAKVAAAAQPWVLVLGAFPLTGPQVRAMVEEFVATELRPTRPLPKILVMFGTLTEEERRELMASASVPLIGSIPEAIDALLSGAVGNPVMEESR